MDFHNNIMKGQSPIRIKPVASIWISLFTLLWLFLLLTLFSPGLFYSTVNGEDIIRWSIHLALLYYGLAVAGMLYLPRVERQKPGCEKLPRCLWTLAWAAYVFHFLAAFHFQHHWSHSSAFEHTRQRGGVGEGIYVNHVFTLLWTVDVLWWWSFPGSHANRPPWIGWLWHGFMIFMIINATIIFEEGPVRWWGTGLMVILLTLLVLRYWRSSGKNENRPGS